ncbi:uncharacterized protein LOC114400439 [Glycine soja]|uniref:uncharacterized protein n=1 Tax=Glycine max TaxID=3847 RepID=UPI0003DE78FA|nr:uncharacterized protein LOC102661380 [Glycine max]XP_028218680.1 uncharacterized protein LOC114400439 [Glycine soja]|eukprot:XP_006604983.1 uncharacterized protein LOC102661380 [Glycine max]
MDCRALFLIHQCVDPQNFAKIVSATSAKQAWDILAKVYAGLERLKRVKMQTLKCQFELLHMNEKEGIVEYLNCVLGLSNQMMACGENLKYQDLVEKVLRTLSSRFDYVVAAIKESKDFTEMKLDELQCSLEAHEQQIKERETYRSYEQALLTKSGRRYKNGSGSSKGKVKSKSHKLKGTREDGIDDSSADETNHDESGSQLRQMGFLHSGKSDKATNTEWYLDTGCSNHMIGKKD